MSKDYSKKYEGHRILNTNNLLKICIYQTIFLISIKAENKDYLNILKRSN